VLAVAVLLANMGLRPLAYRLHPAIPEAAPVETLYEVKLACKLSAAGCLCCRLCNRAWLD